MKIITNNIPQGYKDSPLGIIPEEWEVRKLGDISKITSGSTPLRSNVSYYINGNIPWVKTKDLNNSILISTEENITEIALKETSLKILPIGTILVAMYGGFNQIGRTGLLKIKATINQALAALLIDKEKAHNFFVLNWLNSKVKLWEKYAASSRKDPNITSHDIAIFPILIPPLPEQEKIAEVLSTWDKAIEKQSRLIEKLELRKKGLMQQLLTGKKRLPGFSCEWKTMKLGELFDERNETNMPALPLLSITANKGIILQTESEKKNTSNDDKSKYKRICPNDIGYNTMRMWQGRCALSKLEGIVSPAYTIIIPHNNINPYYMEMLFKQPFMVYRFWTHSQGLVNDTLNCKFPSFSQVKVIIPDLKEQNAIIEILLSCDTEIILANQRFESLRQQKKGLMQVLLTGKNRVIR